MVSEVREEILIRVKELTKESKQKMKKKLGKHQEEADYSMQKLFDELRLTKDKMAKMAGQFDKELYERDRKTNDQQNLL